MPLGSINVDSKGSDLSKVGQYCVLDVSNCLVIFKRGQHKHILISTLCHRQISHDFTLWKIYNLKMSQLGVLDIFFINSHYGKKIGYKLGVINNAMHVVLTDPEV